jgi:hypothetical protein
MVERAVRMMAGRAMSMTKLDTALCFFVHSVT